MDFVPPKRDPRYQWLQGISANVVGEAVKFGGVAGDATAMKALADGLIAKMDLTDAAASALDGARNVEGITQATNIAAIRTQFRNWKTLPGWAASGSEAVLQAKGTSPPVTPGVYKAAIKVTIEAGLIKIGFVKNGVDALAIYMRIRGTATWRKLAVDTESPYYDTTPLATPGVAEVREYMARGVINDEEVGIDSDVVSIAFGG